MIGGDLAQQVAPDRTLPVVFEMVEPVGSLDHRRAAADFGVSDAHAVGSRAEMNFLPQAWRRWCNRRPPTASRRVRRFHDRAHEADALARQGADELLLLAAVADRLAGGVDAARERRIGHDPAMPDRSDEIVLAHHAMAILQQVYQQVEHLGLERDRSGAPSQLAAVKIKYMI